MLEGLGDIAHRPMIPPRPGVTGEEVFAARWEAENRAPGRFNAILDRPDHWTTQRHATLAATIVTWLGTNVGAGFLYQAERLARTMIRADAYVAQWTLENRRQVLVGSGWRRIEQMLMTPDQQQARQRDGVQRGGAIRVRTNIRDFEVAEQLMAWLGSNEGQRFIAAAHLEIDQRDAAAWRAHRSALGQDAR